MLLFLLACAQAPESPLLDRFECGEPFDPGKGDGCDPAVLCCIEDGCWYELESGDQYPCESTPELDCSDAYDLLLRDACSMLAVEALD